MKLEDWKIRRLEDYDFYNTEKHRGDTENPENPEALCGSLCLLCGSLCQKK
jgi:hypothetical protein